MKLQVTTTLSLWSLLILATCVLAQQRSELQLQSSQYHKLLIFIEERRTNKPVREYVELISQIKSGFQNASQMLESLTLGVGRRLKLGSASILVSAKLGQDLRNAGVTVQQAGWQRRDRADFLVTHGTEEGVEGSVAMETGCGKPGKNVVMLARSFTHDTNNIVDRKIALYFSQYRWGLLSESPIASPIFTDTDGELRAATCSAKLDARFADESGRQCEFDVNTRQMSPNCALRLSPKQPEGLLASFLFAPFNKAVSRFCDGQSKDPRLRHNRMADNLQNRQCDGLSAAEVVRMHADYRNTPSGSEPASGDMSFEVVTERANRRVVIVMDVSGSMTLENRIEKMKDAVSQFLTDVIEENSECALISFTDSYQILSDFVSLRSKTERQSLKDIVSSLFANGGTCIGRAVTEAAKLLGLNSAYPSKLITGQIILLSDGQEGCTDYLDRAMGEVSQSSIEVVAIRYGDEADPRMRLLAELTGGKSFFGGTTDHSDSNALRLALGATTGGLEETKRTITLTSQDIGKRFVARSFHVDGTVKRDLVFRISAPADPNSVATLRVLIISPSGAVFGYRDSVNIYKADPAVGSIVIRVPDEHIQSGNWTMLNQTESEADNSGAGGSGGVIVITGRPSENSTEAPVVLTAEVSQPTVDMISNNTRIIVYARLMKGHSPVISGSVFATVSSNDGLVAIFNLTDSGAGADLKSNDGIYSGFLPLDAKLNEARDFSLSVTSQSPVSRVASAGKLTVKRVNPYFNQQLVPPAKVNDLRVKIDLSKKLALLQWTRTEDPAMINRSAGFEFRFSSSLEALLANFANCEKLVIPTKLPDASATSSIIELNVFKRFSDRKGPVFIAVRAVSSLNVTGPPSNVIRLDLTPPSTAGLTRFGLRPIQHVREEKPSNFIRAMPHIIALLGVLAVVTTATVISSAFRRISCSQPSKKAKPEPLLPQWKFDTVNPYQV